MPAVTVNVAEVEPCRTVTVEGTLAAALFELKSETATPPVPAAAVSLRVPVPDWPVTILLGLTDRLLRAADGGLTVRPNVTLAPEQEAVTVTGVDVLTGPAFTMKINEAEPCGTVKVEGTLAASLLELKSDTATPPAPAAAVR